MNKRMPTLEWVVAQSDAEWELLREPALADNLPATNRQRQPPRWGVTLLFLVLTLMGGWAWRSRLPTLPPSTAGDMVIAQPAARAEVADHAALIATIISDSMTTSRDQHFNREERDSHALPNEVIPPGGVEVARMILQGNRAAVSLVFSAEESATTSRQTRFYEHTAVGWLRTAPEATLWGAEQSRETLYFLYHFRQNDAQTVAAVAPQVDVLYTTLRANLGLTDSSTAGKLIIDVSVTISPGAAPPQPGTVGHFSVSSPAVYRAPIELSDEQILMQSIALPLLDRLFAQASEQHGIGSPWRPLLDGLRLWQLWELDLPLAVWRREVVQWVYREVPAKDATQLVSLPLHYAALCRAHQLWMSLPTQFRLPLWCNAQDQGASYTAWWQQRLPPMHLTQLAVPESFHSYTEIENETNRITYPGQTVVLTTLIEYAVAAYGRERLPVLVAGLGQFDSWETLIPAVYGVSPAEFEAGWQAYLMTQYSVSPDTVKP